MSKYAGAQALLAKGDRKFVDVETDRGVFRMRGPSARELAAIQEGDEAELIGRLIQKLTVDEEGNRICDDAAATMQQIMDLPAHVTRQFDRAFAELMGVGEPVKNDDPIPSDLSPPEYACATWDGGT